MAAPERSLTERCLAAVREHFSRLGSEAVLGLPVPIIKDLLPHLTILQLDEVQPALNLRGISTRCGWVKVLQDMSIHKHAASFQTEDETKHEVMKLLFTFIFYGSRNHFISRNVTDSNAASLLLAAAKTIRHFVLIGRHHAAFQRLISEQLPILNLLEKNVCKVNVSLNKKLSKNRTPLVLCLLHRLLDHGAVSSLVLDMQRPLLLAWLLLRRGCQHGDLQEDRQQLLGSRSSSHSSRGSSWSPDDVLIPCKRSKMDSGLEEEGEWEESDFTMDPQDLCRTFGLSPPSGACSRGQIKSLELRMCDPESFRVLTSALPTFFSLQSLTLHSTALFQEKDVLTLAWALKHLSASGRSLITHLNISVLPNAGLMEVLLDACPRLTSLQTEVHAIMWGLPISSNSPPTADSNVSELPLEKLTVQFKLHTNLYFLLSVLRRSPRLGRLHLSGIRLPTGSALSSLLNTLAEWNRRLKTLHLEDMKLSDCLPELLHLLKDCELEDLRLSDCRLLESCVDKDGGLQQLVEALKTLPSLHTLSLAQNRIARSVWVLAELFSGPAPSSVKRLDISSNFIRPPELLRFAKRLAGLAAPQGLVLDLRENPADRDPDTWTAALQRLELVAALLVEGWKSTDTMVDHVSNM
ncbi:leucine-rich repeat-containing protein 41 isoform X2 [Cololabis saira]|uniref:leucine-rich repeat-containing protein 41 isoform X2 n=2 Tax=Cololabis saira TaxID=129043 RepID=UPI002AD25D16|nr:leucine-rich repeat-containing protein 41 isoform X2 [Cololabis saira]XP_061593443.1 leucine-rich repeat-containing protein 41 isoform X2 [Cololabis saira]XP_061593444.1 leucine-rich repeat-containing protein 41 isoform X2 [Cololabis saira]